jgi:ATP/maltotriose-dependent transcriptional regulator MalT
MPVATRWPLVGRRDQLEAFTLALSDAGCEAFCIYGPSGVGKTRLADECAALAEAAGRRVLRATADRSADAVSLGAIAHRLPAHSLAELGEGDVNDAIVRAKLLDAARQALGDLAPEEGRPVLLLDDAHRLDGPSLAVVDHLVATQALFALATVVTGERARDRDSLVAGRTWARDGQPGGRTGHGETRLKTPVMSWPW